MRINGIIAEYNPFHNGHRYHLTESLRRTDAEYTVIVMSGNFVQRGAPALVDKFRRAEMALLNGADLVLELPALYATASAEFFATGAVALLNKLNVVTDLCFGSECGDAQLLQQIAEILAEEPKAYSQSLKRYLRQGLSYPNARNEALIQNYPFLGQHKNVFSSPNNILGIEYIKAIIRSKSTLNPVTVQRTGAGYHSRLPEKNDCSALAIRQALYAGTDDSFLKNNMPEEAARVLSEQLAKTGLVRSNGFSDILYYKLVMEKEHGYDKYLDVSSDLSDRIKARLDEFRGFDSFCDLLKTKEMTYTRISRCLLHIMLNIKKADMDEANVLGTALYARVLGFRKMSSPLLSEIKEHSAIPLLTKLADADELLDKSARDMLNQDIRISQIYNGITARKSSHTPANEIATPLVII
ncbi:MAG: nucleotidyltransferase [Acetatifactor sp.]|nr:nucleotidyltransferase [Acetatifactor sp.]